MAALEPRIAEAQLKYSPFSIMAGLLLIACGGRTAPSLENENAETEPRTTVTRGGTTATGGTTTLGGTTATGGTTTLGGATATGGLTAGPHASTALPSGGSNATSGTTRTSGGAGTTGGTAATTAVGGSGNGGTTFDLSLVKGDYDIVIDSAPEITGCVPSFNERHVTLWLNTANGKTFTLRDFSDFPAEIPTLTVGNGTFALPLVWAGDSYVGSPAMQFALSEHGFVGTGTVEVPYRCADWSTPTRRVSATIAQDRTPPRLSLEPWLRESESSTFAFTEFSPRFSELVKVRDGRFGTLFWDPGEAAEVVGVVDAYSGLPISVTWFGGIVMGDALLQFTDRTNQPGRSIRAELRSTEYADHAGNVAIADPQLWRVLPTLELTSVVDFDAAPSIGLSSNARYEPPSSTAPCESGGCVVVEGNIHSSDLPSSAFPGIQLAVSFGAVAIEKFRIRYRIWAESGHLPTLSIFYPVGCVGGGYGSVQALEATVDGYAMATGWVNGNVGSCAGPEREHGVVIAVTEETSPFFGTVPGKARLVVERLEVLPE